MMKKQEENGEIEMVVEEQVEVKQPKKSKRDDHFEYLISLSDTQYMAYIERVKDAREEKNRAKTLKRKGM
jgi:hypothetical protein